MLHLISQFILTKKICEVGIIIISTLERRKRRHEKVKCFFLSHLARKGQSSGRCQSPSLEVLKPPSGVCHVRDVTVVRGCGGILAPSWRKLCTRAEERKPYCAFRLRRILPEEGMTHEWMAGASWGPWGDLLT